jgi:hypothetical protein
LALITEKASPQDKGVFMSDFQLLDRMLSKMFQTNDDIVLDRPAFDALIEPILHKRSVRENIHSYLSSNSTSPRIIASLVYSKSGNELLREMIEEKGMPAKLLYSPLMFEGSCWSALKAPLPELLRDLIVNGDERWDVAAQETFDQYEPINAFPGVVNALVERFRKLGRIDQPLRHLRLADLSLLLETDQSLFAPEVDAMSEDIKALINPDFYYDHLAKCLLREHLPREDAIAKVLGSGMVARP